MDGTNSWQLRPNSEPKMLDWPGSELNAEIIESQAAQQFSHIVGDWMERTKRTLACAAAKVRCSKNQVPSGLYQFSEEILPETRATMRQRPSTFAKVYGNRCDCLCPLPNPVS